MDFPAFSDYQDVFSAPLQASMFATYTIPTWIPAPTALLKVAKAVYPYWKERRLERNGHRIIPTLNVRHLSFALANTCSPILTRAMSPILSTNRTSVSGEEKAKLSAKRGLRK
jgi:hypothetical protein